MSNPQDNLGTPPPPTPSNSSTPPPPSTSPKPRLRRVKMLARKTVASGDLKKKLNEKLKASQVQDSDSNSDFESYKSASEGEEPGSSDSEKTQESPSKASSSLFENLETRFVLVGPVKEVELPKLRKSGEKVEESGKKSEGSGSGEPAEGLVHLSTQRDEPALSAPKPSKKRKDSSSSTAEISLPKERATRSKVKQSESDLQKALATSKKKKLAKGKEKVIESSEAVEVEEMEQVH
uniref:Protein ENL-like n=1 Tax=Nicotiana tabacum TaxID=4097 RepID=A0A1S4A9B3_TOBAC|nr:PREDICTED: protein ENL-like [Nicotiana tabacum]